MIDKEIFILKINWTFVQAINKCLENTLKGGFIHGQKFFEFWKFNRTKRNI